LEKKQKIFLLKEKFNFQRAQDDVFERRNASAKMNKMEEDRRNAIDYKKNWGIKPFQKKMKF